MTKYLLHRLANLLLLGIDYLLGLLGIVRFRHLPIFATIEPANFCQLSCPECPVGNHSSLREDKQREVLSVDFFRSILSQLSRTCWIIQFYFQGEPLLNPSLPAMISMAHNEGIYTIVSTNALLITPALARKLIASGVNRIIVSIDGLSQTSYSAYRKGGDLHKAVAGLGYLRQAKTEQRARTVIELQCIRLRTNEHEWGMFSRSYKQMGADILSFKTAQLYDYQHGNPLMPSCPKYSRYVLGADGLYHPRNRLSVSPWRALCRRLYTGCVIDVKGNLLPCCFDKGSRYPFGNLHQHSLRDCWFSETANQFRKDVYLSRKSLGICTNCTD